jgi:hypothetical protein
MAAWWYFTQVGPQRLFRAVLLAGCLSSSAAIAASSAAERFGLDDHTAWPADILDWTKSPVDLSFLNAPERPAGRRGFLAVRHDKLVFQDGTVARFWGTNVNAYALFGTSRENVKQQAKG